MKPYYQDETITLYHGKALDVLRTLADGSVDCCVTDPPYELTTGKKGGTGAASLNLNSPAGRARIGTGGFMGKAWDATGIAHSVELWAECLRVLKPGGHLLAFGGTRTWHRLAVAVEDAGFEIRDSIAWLYGSGFPKSLDVSKAIDKAAGADRAPSTVLGCSARRPQMKTKDVNAYHDGVGNASSALLSTPATPGGVKWDGWGTALKPAFEPIVMGRKPLVGTVAANVITHGTGALNIDGCRVGQPSRSPSASGWTAAANGEFLGVAESVYTPNQAGRWPANVALDEDQAAALDAQTGILASGVMHAKTIRADRDPQVYGRFTGNATSNGTYGDSGGASRFLYVAKASSAERPTAGGTAHPTVKPLTLMRWLCRLVTPPGGTILEPFAGSGTTVEAALSEGFKCIAIEREASYLPLIQARIARTSHTLDFGDAS